MRALRTDHSLGWRACVQCVQISDPWLAAAVLELGSRSPEAVDKPRGWPLPIYDCFDRVRACMQPRDILFDSASST